MILSACAGNGNPAAENGNKTVPFQIIKAAGGVISIPETDLTAGNPKFYIYRDQDKSVRFFVLRSSDGVVRAAYDACEVCFRNKKGFHQEGDYTVCNNCGNRYPSVNINVITGGCNPIPLNRVAQNGNINISADEVKKGSVLF
jgi:uncharacterized membrane protein